jgi:hypothetical protein
MSALLLMLSLAWADDLAVTSKVTGVTVYRDRARVVRTVQIEVPAGRTDLVFDGLPLQLITQSLSAEGEGTARATLTGIDVRPQRGVEDRDERLRKLADTKESLEDRIRVERDRIARVQADIAFLQSLQPRATPQLEEGLFLADDAAAQLAATSRAVGNDLVALYKEQRTAEQAIRQLQRELDATNREISELQSGGGPDTQRVAVGLDAQRAGTVTVRLSYVVTGAGWSPHWDARYRPNDGKVRLDLSADVRQSTGEDWDDVRLTLSTASPQQSTQPPQLQPFYLQPGYGVAGGQVADADRVTAVEYAAPTVEDVPADGTRRRVYLQSKDLAATVVHHVVARRVEAAWLTARVKNDSDTAWMAGSVSAYMGTAYVGEGQLNVTAPGAEADLSFGVDDRVRVKRTRLNQKSDDAKGLQNRDRISYGWKTAITNRTGRSIQLVVHEQIPASRDAAFEVTATTTPPVQIPETGVFEWKADLADGKSQDFVLEYTVSWPQGDRPVLME